ncbi:MAG: hypothetical protein WCI73_20995, partial [Phycisphaerae bacterium]
AVQHGVLPPAQTGLKAARARKALVMTVIPTSTDHRAPSDTISAYAVENGWCDRLGNGMAIVPLKAGKRPERISGVSPGKSEVTRSRKKRTMSA